jgi:hypothetical protein
MPILITLLLLLLVPALAHALTITWDCNTEADMKEYRLELSKDQQDWRVEGIKAHTTGCNRLSMDIGRYLDPGPRWARAFALDKVGNSSQPSKAFDFVIKPSPIGGAGQTEATKPASPWGTSTPPPPPVPQPVPPPTPPPPPVKPLSNLATIEVAETSATAVFVVPQGQGVEVRLIEGPAMSWGTSKILTCPGSPCIFTGLKPDTRYTWQAITFVGQLNTPTITWGPFGAEQQFVTLGVVPPPQPPPAPNPPPPPPPTVEQELGQLKDRLDAIRAAACSMGGREKSFPAKIAKALGGCP